MALYLAVLFFVAGLALLVKGSGLFVESAARVARFAGISIFVIGLSLVAIGTSLPELASSVFASFAGHPELVIGNVVGSNIANIALILGIAGLFAGRIRVVSKIFEYDFHVMALSTVLLFVFSLDGVISFFEGLFFLILFVYYLMFLFKLKPHYHKLFKFEKYLSYFHSLKERVLAREEKAIERAMQPTAIESIYIEKYPFLKKIYLFFMTGVNKEIVLIVIGGIGVIFGAYLLVDGAVEIALWFKVSKELIALLMVAVGTSIPELMIAITAVRKGLANILVGNLIGSNIANILLIMGVSSLIAGVPMFRAITQYSLFALIVISILLSIMISKNRDIDKTEAAVLLGIYFLFVLGLIPYL